VSIRTNFAVDDADSKRFLEQMSKNAPAAFGVALYLFAGRVMAMALRLTPVDSGSLRRSHYVAPPSSTPTRVLFDMGFVAPYAGWVHNDIGAKHINGSAKFLETPFLQRLAVMPSEVARDLMRLRWGTIPPVPALYPTRGVFEPTGAKSRHRGAGAAGRDAKARSKATERMAQRAARQALRKR
jgi:hypothetical protein